MKKKALKLKNILDILDAELQFESKIMRASPLSFVEKRSLRVSLRERTNMCIERHTLSIIRNKLIRRHTLNISLMLSTNNA
jgi:hypothetical protein